MIYSIYVKNYKINPIQIAKLPQSVNVENQLFLFFIVRFFFASSFFKCVVVWLIHFCSVLLATEDEVKCEQSQKLSSKSSVRPPPIRASSSSSHPGSTPTNCFPSLSLSIVFAFTRRAKNPSQEKYFRINENKFSVIGLSFFRRTVHKSPIQGIYIFPFGINFDVASVKVCGSACTIQYIWAI